MHTIQLESFGACLPEFKEVIGTHHAELAMFKDRMPLDPAWEVYLAREARGELIFTTCRVAGRLVGYFAAFMAPGLHYRQTLTVTMDIIYVLPEFRHKGWVVKMLDFSLAEYRRRGAYLCYVGSKVGSSLHPGLERVYLSRKFEPIDLYYGLWLTEK
jgi:GNAT superfamily N-acetyltransferase